MYSMYVCTGTYVRYVCMYVCVCTYGYDCIVRSFTILHLFRKWRLRRGWVYARALIEGHGVLDPTEQDGALQAVLRVDGQKAVISGFDDETAVRRHIVWYMAYSWTISDVNFIKILCDVNFSLESDANFIKNIMRCQLFLRKRCQLY